MENNTQIDKLNNSLNDLLESNQKEEIIIIRINLWIINILNLPLFSLGSIEITNK
jgi:hypothetical protein